MTTPKKEVLDSELKTGLLRLVNDHSRTTGLPFKRLVMELGGDGFDLDWVSKTTEAVLAIPPDGKRGLDDGVAPQEVEYEARFAAEVKPVLGEMYRDGLDSLRSLPETADEFHEVVAYLIAFLSAHPVAQTLIEVLEEMMEYGYNTGGSLGLAELGYEDTTFENSSARVNRMISDHAENQAALIISTTAHDIANRYQASGAMDGTMSLLAFIGSVLLVFGSIITYRALVIGRHEGVWATRQGLLWLFRRMGVLEVEFRTQRDGLVDNGDPLGPCVVQDGKVYPIDEIPEEAVIPIHFGCRCYYLPLFDPALLPTEPWRGQGRERDPRRRPPRVRI